MKSDNSTSILDYEDQEFADSDVSARTDFEVAVSCVQKLVEKLGDSSHPNPSESEPYTQLSDLTFDATTPFKTYKSRVYKSFIVQHFSGQEQVASEGMRPVVFVVHLEDIGSDLIAPENKVQEAGQSRTSDSLEISNSVESKIENIFYTANSEEFEDGMDNEFVKFLFAAVRLYENSAILEIHNLTLKEQVNPIVAGEALRWLGDVDHKPTYGCRRWLLEKAVSESSSALVRDGANVGLAFMDDPHAVPYLQRALLSENNALLRKMVAKTLNQLERTEECISRSE